MKIWSSFLRIPTPRVKRNIAAQREVRLGSLGGLRWDISLLLNIEIRILHMMHELPIDFSCLHGSFRFDAWLPIDFNCLHGSFRFVRRHMKEMTHEKIFFRCSRNICMEWMEVIWEKGGFGSWPSQKSWKISEGKKISEKREDMTLRWM